MEHGFLRRVLKALLAFSLLISIQAAHADDILLGPGDVLKIAVYGNPDLTLEARISEAGSISYPLIGEVSIGGISVAAAEKKIAGMLEEGGFIRKPQVSMIVTSMQSQQVSVLGQVNKPGRFPIDGKRSLTDILALAGGASADATDTVTLIRSREGKTTRHLIDLVDIVRTADPQKNPDLIAGDVVFVERAPRFYIYGEVLKPGSYRLERDLIVLQALSIGGGLSPRGTERGVRIKRRDQNGILKIINAKHDDVVKVDDVVYVQESLF